MAPGARFYVQLNGPVIEAYKDLTGHSTDSFYGAREWSAAENGEKDGQLYLEWGADMAPDFDHYELWRDGKFLANVTNEAPKGIPYRNARYEDLNLPTHSRHVYKVRSVYKDGRAGEWSGDFEGLTRGRR